MNYKDSMGNEIKNILEEESIDLKLSSKTVDNIMGSRKVSLLEKVNNFLNMEIEVPLTPAIIGFILILGISIFPKDFITTEKVEIINLNGSQIIMTSKKEVSIK
jgi:hypothetical protein